LVSIPNNLSASRDQYRRSGHDASTILYITGMTTFPLPIDRALGTPIHRQIYEGVRQAILTGRLRPGQRIPSTRGLAEELGVSRLPVLSAYDQLLHEGYLTGRMGSGTFVSRAVPDDLMHPPPLPTVAAVSARSPVPTPGPPPTASEPGPFQIGVPALDEFPRALWARLVARRAHALTPAQMSYTDPAGLMPLRAAIADHVRTARAVRCEAEQVLVVSGSQAALSLCAAVLLSPGDRVALEDPGYFGAHRAFGARGVELVPVPVDDGASASARSGGAAAACARCTSRRRTSTRSACRCPRAGGSRCSSGRSAARPGSWRTTTTASFVT
jgi:GntR family transcriptional regulator/MocR family aminotransferase